MFDLDQARFSVSCPECRFHNSATIRHVRLSQRLICRGCKREIQLTDKKASAVRARRQVSDALKAFGNDLKLGIKL